MKYKLKKRSTKATPSETVSKRILILVSYNMLNGTNLTLNFDMALVSTQVKILLNIVGLKAKESFDTSMSTCDKVGAYTRALENQ